MKNLIVKVKICCHVKVAKLKNGYNKKVSKAKLVCKEKKELAKRNMVDSICNG